jgi:putative oxidoreductase
MRKFLFDCGTRDATASLGILVLRIGTGLIMFFGHGLGKIQAFAEKKDGWTVPDFFPLNYMSAPVSLMATIGAEVVCAAMMVLGIATRPAAFILAFTMTVAAFYVHASGPLFMSGGPGSKELALLFLIPCVAILLSGAGSYSVDSLIFKESRRKRW